MPGKLRILLTCLLLACSTIVGFGQAKKSKTAKSLPNKQPKIEETIAAPAVEKAPMLQVWEMSLLHELNTVRANPSQAIALLEEYRKFYKGNELQLPKSPTIETNEGVAAVDEAINFVRNYQPLPKLQVSQALTLAANDHLADMLATGISGHQGTDGSLPNQRINRRGVNTQVVGENISFYTQEARTVIFWMLIDDGNKRRGHRNNIFSPRFGYLGIASGQSKQLGRICIITFAEQKGPAGIINKAAPVKLN